MKQLKFMLAAATAIGLATAAQADQKFKDTFEDGEMPAGYSYVPVDENDNDNESQIEADGYNSEKALKVNTGTNPLLRALDYVSSSGSAQAVPLSATKSVYIDTMVKFTLTPTNDTPTPVAGDKLMIYVEEVPAVGETPASNKLVIWAAGDDVDGNVSATKCETNLAIDTDKWYRLYVESVAVLAGQNAENEDMYYPCFKISLAEEGETLAPIASSAEFAGLAELDDPSAYFPSLEILSAPDGVVNPAITYVGFAGEGKVDDLAFGTVETVTGIDFTLTLGTGVSAVTYTLAGTEYTVTGTTAISHEEASSIAVTAIDYVLGYKAGINGKGDYSADVTIDAAEVVINDGTAEGSTATTAADLQITNEKFANDSPAQLTKLTTWAKNYSVSLSTVNGMTFADEEVESEAYLLNCAPTAEAVEDAKAAFKFPAITAGEVPAVYEPEEGYNVEPKIFGADSIEALKTSEVPATADHKFFKAVLTK